MMKSLEKIVEFLRRNKIIFADENDDGRLNSATNESLVLQVLASEFKEIKISNLRQWFDFKICENSQNDILQSGAKCEKNGILQGNEIFVNIKISDLENGAADNCSSKLGMGYALCGVQNMPLAWDKFHEMLANELKIGYDYYFLVLNKNDSCDCFYTSLKRIKTLVPNGNNLPFQCDWGKNREFSARSEVQAMRYILDIYLQSWDKKVKGYPFKLKEMFVNGKILDSE